MAEELYTWTPAQSAASRVLIVHQRGPDGLCGCGAADLMLDVGYYAGHVVDELTKAGVFGGPRQHDGIAGMLRDAEEPYTRPMTRPMTVADLVAAIHPDWSEEQVAEEARRVVEERG